LGALAERLTLLREIEAGKAAIARAWQDPRHRNAEQLSGRPNGARDTQKEQ
jgi:hypothetical protein